jgi:DNA-directed RNA polymerase I, II, and III subunit RPABC1
MNVGSQNKEYNSPAEIAISTITEMILQRGYKVISEEDGNIIAETEIGEQMLVFTKPVIKFNVDRIKEHISVLDKMKMKHCVVVYIDSITPPTKKLVKNSVDMKIEIFTQKELQYNITKHRLVPKHERLSEEEANEFKKKFGIKFPSILLTDPITRFYNYQRGDVIKITRLSNRGKHVSYRIVKG